MTFLFAQGSVTSSITMANAVLMLAIHPAVQQRVYDEILTVGPVETLSNEDLHRHLSYTEMVLKETMRLYTPTISLARQVTEDVELSDITLPKGTVCIVPTHHFHRDPKVWGDTADEFDPERFTVERSANRDPFFYMPFSAGTRNCIGQRYAMVSMKIFLFHLMRQFEFDTNMKYDELQFSYTPFFELANNYAVKLRRRPQL